MSKHARIMMLAVAVILPATAGCKASGLIPSKKEGPATNASTPDPVLETLSPAAGVISASSTETQRLAGTGAAKGAMVAFPPGSVALDTNVSLVPGGHLGADVLTELAVEAKVLAAGTSIVVDSSGINDPAGTLSITLPLPDAAALSLTTLAARPIVIYRVVVKATGEYLAGVVPEAEFTGVDATKRTVTVDFRYFGQFQTLYVDASIGKRIEKKSATIGFKGPSGNYEPSATTKPAEPSGPTTTNTDSGGGSGTTTNPNPGSSQQPSAPGEFQLVSPSGTLPSRKVSVTWTPSNGASDMTISLGSSADCASPVLTTTVAASLGQASFTGVANGTYFACAKASNAAGAKSIAGGSFTVGPVVIGKPNFTTTTCAVSSSCTSNVVSAVYSHGRLIATDDKNHRVLIWHKLPTSSGVSADLVLGQADFTSITANRGGVVNGGALNSPLGVASDGTRLIVSDSGNHRLLIWSTFPTASGQAADLVLGQSDLTATDGPGAAGLNLPYQPRLFDGKLVLADTENNRVLIWNTLPTANATPADVIIGQPDMWSASPGTDASTMYTPIGVTIVQGDLWVSDSSNHRLIRFKPFPTASFVAADIVIGQPDMTASSPGTSATAFNYPNAAATDGSNLIVPDADNNRILTWNTAPTASGAVPDAVFGQANFTTGSAQPASEGTLSYPTQVHVEDGTMVIADWGNKRVLLRPYP